MKNTTKNNKAYQRHDISDQAWAKIEHLLPGRKGTRGPVAQDNRRFINAVCWIFRTGAPWRDLPTEYGDWKNTHRRFSRWRDSGKWDAIVHALSDDQPDLKHLIIDATHIKVHPHAAGARGGNQAMNHTKGGAIRNYI